MVKKHRHFDFLDQYCSWLDLANTATTEEEFQILNDAIIRILCEQPNLESYSEMLDKMIDENSSYKPNDIKDYQTLIYLASSRIYENDQTYWTLMALPIMISNQNAFKKIALDLSFSCEQDELISALEKISSSLRDRPLPEIRIHPRLFSSSELPLNIHFLKKLTQDIFSLRNVKEDSLTKRTLAEDLDNGLYYLLYLAKIDTRPMDPSFFQTFMNLRKDLSAEKEALIQKINNLLSKQFGTVSTLPPNHYLDAMFSKEALEQKQHISNFISQFIDKHQSQFKTIENIYITLCLKEKSPQTDDENCYLRMSVTTENKKNEVLDGTELKLPESDLSDNTLEEVIQILEDLGICNINCHLDWTGDVTCAKCSEKLWLNYYNEWVHLSDSTCQNKFLDQSLPSSNDGENEENLQDKSFFPSRKKILN